MLNELVLSDEINDLAIINDQLSAEPVEPSSPSASMLVVVSQ